MITLTQETVAGVLQWVCHDLPDFGNVLGPVDAIGHDEANRLGLGMVAAYRMAGEEITGEYADLLAVLKDCLGFWDAPPEGFGCTPRREADLKRIKAAARAAVSRAEGGAA